MWAGVDVSFLVSVIRGLVSSDKCSSDKYSRKASSEN